MRIEIGQCQECKFWDPKSKDKLARECMSMEMQSKCRTSYQTDQIEVDRDFGCIHFESKE